MLMWKVTCEGYLTSHYRLREEAACSTEESLQSAGEKMGPRCCLRHSQEPATDVLYIPSSEPPSEYSKPYITKPVFRKQRSFTIGTLL